MARHGTRLAAPPSSQAGAVLSLLLSGPGCTGRTATAPVIGATTGAVRAGAFWAPAEGTQPGHLNAGTGERQLPSSALSLGTVGGHDPLPRQNPPMLTLRLP